MPSEWVSQLSAWPRLEGADVRGLHLVDADGQFRVELRNLGGSTSAPPYSNISQNPKTPMKPGDPAVGVIQHIQIRISSVGLSQHLETLNSNLRSQHPNKRIVILVDIPLN